MFGNQFLGIGHGVYFGQDDGAGGGDAAQDDPTDNSAGANGEGDPASREQAGDDKGKQPAAAKVTFTAEQQAAVDLIIKERLERANKHAEAESKRIQALAQEEALTKNKEFETLAEQRKTKVGELEAQVADLTPFKEQAEKYKAAMDKILSAQVAKLPKAIKVLIDKLDPIEKMQYIADHAKELNIEVLGIPETDTSDTDKKLNAEAEARAKTANKQLVKGFFGG